MLAQLTAALVQMLKPRLRGRERETAILIGVILALLDGGTVIDGLQVGLMAMGVHDVLE